MLGLQILSTFFLASATARLLTQNVIDLLQLNFFANAFSKTIPGVTESLAAQKTHDLVNFSLFIILCFLVFILVKWASKSKDILASIGILIFSLVIFIQIYFGNYSIANTAIFIICFSIFAKLLGERKNVNEIRSISDENKWLLLGNGFLSGFSLMLLVNNYTTTILPITFLIVTIMFYFAFPKKQQKFLLSKYHLFLVVSALFPTKPIFIILLTVIVAIAALKKEDLQSELLLRYFYPSVFIFLAIYNPLYFIGHFDSVEEGFWLGWLVRLIKEGALYKDVFVYHPPLIVWGLYLFQKVVGFSLANTRLMLHLLQVLGFIFYYFTINKLIKNKFNRLIVMIIAMSLTAILVKNNVEIRLGVGLLSLAFFERKRLFWSGLVASLSFFVSVEVGVAAFLALAVGIALFKTNKIKSLLQFTFGAILGAMPTLGTLLFSGSFIEAIKQITFYSQAFSSGYFNLPIEETSNLNFVQWFEVNNFVGSNIFLWEVAKWGALGALLYAVNLKLGKKLIHGTDKFAVVLSIFTLFIFRSALGRADYYHLLFPLLVSVALIFYIVERLSNLYKLKYLNIIFGVLFLFVIIRDPFNQGFLDSEIIKAQTYGQVLGNYHIFGGERGGILITENQSSKDTELLVQYIKANTNDNDSIFTFPWAPEIYFLTNRKNATRFDTPYAAFTKEYQEEMIRELEMNKPKFIVYNPDMKFGDLSPDSLPLVKEYIESNFQIKTKFGSSEVLVQK